MSVVDISRKNVMDTGEKNTNDSLHQCIDNTSNNKHLDKPMINDKFNTKIIKMMKPLPSMAPLGDDLLSLSSVDIGVDGNHALLSPCPLPHSTSETSSFYDTKFPTIDAFALQCEMCANYETKLQQIQELERSLKQQLAAAHHLSDRYQTELSGERLYRKELETQMGLLSKEAQDRMNTADGQCTYLETKLLRVIEEYSNCFRDIRAEFDNVREKSSYAERQLIDLHDRYIQLLGVHRCKSAEMRAQIIELPQTIDELQLTCLQLREQLIESRAAKEHIEDTFKGQIAVLNEQQQDERTKASTLEENLLEEINLLRTKLGTSESQVTVLNSERDRAEDAEKRVAEFQTTIADLEARLGTLQTERGELEFDLKETKGRGFGLQQELDTSEAVQRDFVQLSQSLQIQLEKIRQAEQEVRWQFDEDVHMCPTCRLAFTKTRLKHHCRHCGSIFCDSCLSKQVSGGPHNRQAKVCDVCYTLLVRDTAPYFSESAPNYS